MKNNQLINPLQALIDAASQKAASGKIEKVVARHQSRQQATTNNRFVLADVSGSMSEMAGNYSSKIELLKKALSDPSLDWSTQQLVAFGSFPENISHPSLLPRPAGGTALHSALDFITPNQPQHILVISDGQPDSRDAALKAADKITGKIDVIYIGPDDDFEAIRFMYELAGRTGGRVVVNDLRKLPKQLPATIQKLLK
jgi:Mg-chelatase subunit ChlD